MDHTQPQGGLVGDPDHLLDQLDSLLDHATALPVACLRRDQVITWLSRMQRIKARIDGLTCTGLNDARLTDANNVILSSGRSVADAVAFRARSDPRSVARDQHLASWLRRFDGFAVAFVQGWLTRSHLDVLRRLDNRRTRHHLHEAQDHLIDAARRCSWVDFVTACRYWELTFDPDGAEPAEQVANRSMNHHRHADGTVTGHFQLDPLAGAAVTNALEQHYQRLFRDDAETGSERTATQRRADALVQLITGSGADRPPNGALIHLVMSHRVAEDTLAQMALTPSPERPTIGLDPDDIDRRCELVDGTPVHPRFALAAVATATLRRMVFGAEGEILDLGRSARGFPRHLKQALLVQARGRCQSSGCGAPLSWLQADHLVPWNHHGRTAVSNGQILCDPHNKVKRDRTEG